MKDIQIGMEGAKFTLVADDMILYREKPEDSRKNLLEFIMEFTTVVGYKINIQISLVFFIYFVLLFKYSCLHFPPTTPPSHPIHPCLSFSILQFYPLCLCSCVLYTCSLITINFSPLFPSPLPLWLLSVCLFQCLWLYFTCLSVFWIKFHL